MYLWNIIAAFWNKTDTVDFDRFPWDVVEWKKQDILKNKNKQLTKLLKATWACPCTWRKIRTGLVYGEIVWVRGQAKRNCKGPLWNTPDSIFMNEYKNK